MLLTTNSNSRTLRSHPLNITGRIWTRSAPRGARSACVPRLTAWSAGQQAGDDVAHDRLIALIENLHVGRDDRAAALGCWSRGGHFHRSPDAIADSNRREHLGGDLQQRHAGPLNHGLQDKSLDDRLGEGGRYRSSTHDAAVLGIDEDGLQHARHADEVDEIGLGQGAAEGTKLRAHCTSWVAAPADLPRLLHMQFVAFGRRSGISRRLIYGINAGE
jgi:hypothetical protein